MKNKNHSHEDTHGVQHNEQSIRVDWKISQNNNNLAYSNVSNSGSQELTYLSKYQQKYGSLNENFMNEKQLNHSMNQIRTILKILDQQLWDKINKNYKYLAQHNQKKQQPSIEKHLEILQASKENNQKKLIQQKIQLDQITEYQYQLDDPDCIMENLQDNLQALLRLCKQGEKDNKEKAIQVQKCDLVIVGNAVEKQDNQTYIRYKKLKFLHDYKKNKTKEYEQHIQNLDTKNEELGYSLEELKEKLVQYTKIAQKQFLEVKVNKKYIELKEKFIAMQKQVSAQRKKKQLAIRGIKHNQYLIFKQNTENQKVIDYLNKRIQEIQTQSVTTLQNIQKSISDTNTKTNDPSIKNIIHKYNQMSLQRKPNQQLRSNRISTPIKQVNLHPKLFKKGMKSVQKPPSRYQKSKQKQKDEYQFQFENYTPEKKKQKLQNEEDFFEDKKSNDKNINNNKSHIQLPTSKPLSPQHKVSSKPLLRIRKQKHNNLHNSMENPQINKNIEEVPNLKPSRFSRLGQKRKVDKQISQDYMKVLEQRGRKILGI